MRDTAASPRRPSIVGVAEDGVEGLSAAARAIWKPSNVSLRGLRLAGACDPGGAGAAVAEPVRRRGRRAWAGDRGGPGRGARLGRSVRLRRRRGAAQKVDAREVTASRWCRSLQSGGRRLAGHLPASSARSLHGRALDLVRPHLQPGARILRVDDWMVTARLVLRRSCRGRRAPEVSRLTVLEASVNFLREHKRDHVRL